MSNEPKRYNGVPYLCTSCGMYYTQEHCDAFNQPDCSYAEWFHQINVRPGKDCRLELPEDAMARRAKWLLAQQFDPTLKDTKFK